jgi:hypothetical protein
VFVPDSRGVDQFLRVTWHDDARQFVLSVWQGELCVAAVRIGAHDAPELVRILVDGLADAAEKAAGSPVAADQLPA